MGKLELAVKEGIEDLDEHIRKQSAHELVERELNLLERKFNALGSELTVVKEEEYSTEARTSIKKRYTDVTLRATMYVKGQRATEKHQDRKIKLDKIPLPKFDGNRRLYPKFKKDFTTLILPNIAKT